LKKIILAVALAAVAIMAVAASVASAGGPPARYQANGLTITATQPYGQVGQFNSVWTHVFNVTFDSTVCGASTGSFSGTGIQYDNNGVQSNTEKVTGTVDAGKVTLNVVRDDGVTWTLTNAPLDGSTVTLATTDPAVSWPVEFKVSATPVSDFKNHGDYVSSVGGGSDAAHSCIGMPIK
jgi:hypothetical protein